MSVKVAVRVRPFNGREKELNSTLCVGMEGPMTILINPEDQKERPFTFDYSFWSHDGFENDENGYSHAVDPRYADQQRVFDLVGKEVLNNAWEGYHCCLFAYGQTGAGKSYSMVGYGANRGIVPISCEEIFKRIQANTDPTVSFELTFSMQEIYNERIQDLLIPVKDRPKEGLKVREHQKYGVYVDGLSRHPVDSYEAIEEKMEDGAKNRTIGSTLMNASSSRAHTIMTIEFKKIEMINGKKTEKFAVINLVDLAGSEKAGKTGASGDRLKEGCAINQSLSSLGLVISKLADKAMGKKNIVVPYRDSALTRILQNALGGNSKTLMICAISPASDNYDETLSTLRYADQAKKIKNNAVINESEQDKMIRELREENEKLKAMLGNYQPGEGPASTGNNLVDEETMRKFKEMEEQLKANADMMKQYDQTFEEKLAEAKAKHAAMEPQIDKTKPYLLNLNEDPLLSGKILHSLAKEKVLIGRKNVEPVPDIVLGGIGIKAQHAEILNEDGKISISPCDRECGEQLYVNGQKIYEKKELNHNDRIIIGTNSTFLLKLPGHEDESPNADKLRDEQLDWEFAQSELIALMDEEKKLKLDELAKEREKEVESKIKEIENQYQLQKSQNDNNINKQKEEYEKRLLELEEQMKKETEKQKLEIEKREAEKEFKEQMARYEADRLFKEKERERMQKEVQEEATLKRFKEQEKIHLEHKLAKHLSQITEINLIAKELNRDVVFSIKLVYNFVSGAELQLFGGEKSSKTKIQVFVQNKETNHQYVWSLSKFNNRYFMIKDLLEAHYEGGQLPRNNTTEDPFWDPPEARMIAQGFLCMESLGYLIDNPAELHLVTDSGTIGKLNVNLVPLTENGEPMNDDDDIIEDPTELVDKRLDFAIIIEDGELPEKFCRDTYCQYSLLKDDSSFEIYKTNIVQGVSAKPEYRYKKHHSFDNVSERTLNYILNHNLKIQLYGFDVVEEKPAGTEPKKAAGKKGPKLAIETEETEKSGSKGEITENEEFTVKRHGLTPVNASNNDQAKEPRRATFAVNTKLAPATSLNPQIQAAAQQKLAATQQKGPAGKDGKDNKDCNIF